MTMRKFAALLGANALPCPFAILVGLLAVAVSGISSALVQNAVQDVGVTPMHKVQLTQKGYIQFLRWELAVPEIQKFTFCLWMKSSDLKYPHSILSYSKNERERLIRSWISSRGRSVHLEINGAEIFRSPARLREHRWYHMCQSWENRIGRYALWLDGRLLLQARSDQMIDRVIPGGGDIVLGQEYTDFDKGLEEGIEGSVLGFNFLLASAFGPLDNDYQSLSLEPVVPASSFKIPFATKLSSKPTTSDVDSRTARIFLDRLVSSMRLRLDRKIFRRRTEESYASSSSSSRLLSAANATWNERPPVRRVAIALPVDDTLGEIDVSGVSPDTPLGLQLVKLSYAHCQLDGGSPAIGGPLMLISWSRTPVRVFGGATIKNARNECGNF